jgi:hypothetical protein
MIIRRRLAVTAMGLHLSALVGLLLACDSAPPNSAITGQSNQKTAQFDKCAYVYDTESKIRECLVMRNGWSPGAAEVAILTYKAEIRRVNDSIRRVVDSLGEIDAKRVAIERKRQQAAASAAGAAAQAKRRRQSEYAAMQPYWGSIATKLYYANTPHCEGLAAFDPSKDLQFFKTREEAEQAGYEQVKDPGCLIPAVDWSPR